jgi:hypothetical protein
MRTCKSCGKANNPIRKYCVRCGKPLITVKDDKPTPAPTSVITETPIPDIQPSKGASEDQHVRSDSMKATTDDEWVRPSQVSRDRMRSTSSSSGKSEMEKAKEAFARAEGFGIDEADGSGIIETRMLRASEVRELMGDEAVISQDSKPTTQPAPSITPTPPAATPPAASSMPPGVDATPQPTLTPKPSPTPTPTTNKPEPAVISTPRVENPLPTAPPNTPVKPPTPAPIATSPSSSINLDARVPEIEEILSQVSEPEDLQDSKIKDLIASLTTQHAELRKVKEDFANVSNRLDEFVLSCFNDAEVKRIHYESLCEQERFAKQEYESSKKEYERVDKRRKKEVSSLEDKVKNVEKNIAKSEDSVKKRIEELDKVREKIAQLQSQDS